MYIVLFVMLLSVQGFCNVAMCTRSYLYCCHAYKVLFVTLTHRYQAENQRLKDQVEENTHLAESLRFELSVYEHIHTKGRTFITDFGGLAFASV